MASSPAVSNHAPAPGPRGLPIIGIVPSLLRDPFNFMMGTASRYDGIVRLRIGPIEVYLISGADYVKYVLVDNNHNYFKGPIMQGIRTALGNGLFTSDGDLWRRQRRLMQPAFHEKQISQMTNTVLNVAQTHFARWQPHIAQHEPVDLVENMTLINIDIILQVLFGTKIGTDEAKQIRVATNNVFKGMNKRVWMFFVPSGVPLPGINTFKRAIGELNDLITKIIENRQHSDSPGDDLLGLLLSMRDEDTDEGMSSLQLRDEIMTLLVAGYESTSAGISWGLYLLSQHPEIAQRVRAEVDEILGQRLPTFEDLPRLTYLNAVINETLRLYPPFPMYFRTSINADTIGNYYVPGNANIVISPYATHHDPRYWKDPENFDPDRFLGDRAKEIYKPAYYPFGQGQRQCIGRDLSLLEQQLILAMIFQRFDFQLAAGSKVETDYALSLQAKPGLPMLLQPRSAFA